jgi:hypothetical protein
MKCPYLINEVVNKRIHKPTILEHEADDGDNYVLTTNDTTKSTIRYFADCLLDECACYQDGKCHKR